MILKQKKNRTVWIILAVILILFLFRPALRKDVILPADIQVEVCEFQDSRVRYRVANNSDQTVIVDNEYGEIDRRWFGSGSMRRSFRWLRTLI